MIEQLYYRMDILVLLVSPSHGRFNSRRPSICSSGYHGSLNGCPLVSLSGITINELNSRKVLRAKWSSGFALIKVIVLIPSSSSVIIMIVTGFTTQMLALYAPLVICGIMGLVPERNDGLSYHSNGCFRFPTGIELIGLTAR